MFNVYNRVTVELKILMCWEMFSLHGLCENAGLLIFSCFTAFITIRHVQHIMPLCINLPYQNCDKFKTIVFLDFSGWYKKKKKKTDSAKPPDTEHQILLFFLINFI